MPRDSNKVYRNDLEAMANEVPGPRNQVESLEKELAFANAKIREQEQELLNLYRRLHDRDSPKQDTRY